MAGVEPASRTLLYEATTLISGVRCFVKRNYTCKGRSTIHVFTLPLSREKKEGAYLREPKLKRGLCHPPDSE
jgi:hypothetical protein